MYSFSYDIIRTTSDQNIILIIILYSCCTSSIYSICKSIFLSNYNLLPIISKYTNYFLSNTHNIINTIIVNNRCSTSISIKSININSINLLNRFGPKSHSKHLTLIHIIATSPSTKVNSINIITNSHNTTCNWC